MNNEKKVHSLFSCIGSVNLVFLEFGAFCAMVFLFWFFFTNLTIFRIDTYDVVPTTIIYLFGLHYIFLFFFQVEIHTIGKWFFRES